MANLYDKFDSHAVDAPSAAPAGNAGNYYDRFDPIPPPQPPATPAAPAAPADTGGGWFHRNIGGPLAYVGGKAVSAGLGLFEQAAQAEMAQAGYSLDQTHFDPNVEVFGTKNPKAPNTWSDYAGEVASNVAGNPLFAALAPEATILGTLVGKYAENQGANPVISTIAGAVAGGATGLVKAGIKGILGTTEYLAKQLGTGMTRQEAGNTVQTAAKDFMTTGLPNAKTSVVNDLRNTLTSKTYLTQQEIDDAINTAKSKLADLDSQAKHIEKVANAATPEKSFGVAMQDANSGGSRLSALRTHLPDATDELASAHLLQTPKGWAKLSDEAKEALVPDAGMRARIDDAVSKTMVGKARDIVGEGIFTGLMGDWGEQALHGLLTHIMTPGTAKAIPLIAGAAPLAFRGAQTIARNPLAVIDPIAGGTAAGSVPVPQPSQ